MADLADEFSADEEDEWEEERAEDSTDQASCYSSESPPEFVPSDAVHDLTSTLPHVQSLYFERVFFSTLHTPDLCFGPLKHQITSLTIHSCVVLDNFNAINFVSMFQNLEKLEMQSGSLMVHYLEEPLPGFPADAVVPPRLNSLSCTWTRFVPSFMLWLLRDPPPLRSLDIYASTPLLEVDRSSHLMFALLHAFGPQLEHFTIDSRGYETLADLEGTCSFFFTRIHPHSIRVFRNL